MPTEAGGDAEPLAFQFLAEPENPDAKPGDKVMTGHDNGVITIALDEADDATREKIARKWASHTVRFWAISTRGRPLLLDKLVRDGGLLDSCRALFGDDREDYQEAIKRHYAKDDDLQDSWQQGFVSSYATMHPWEDWAETWAHYLHIVDTLEMAAAFGITVQPEVSDDRISKRRSTSIRIGHVTCGR